MTALFTSLTDVLREAWYVTAEMSPYLLFGFFVAGLLFVAIPARWVAEHLGGRGWLGPVKAALFGVPLPLCSCGVIPVAVSLRKHGASRGSTAAFLMSTPQTGVDSLLVTWGLLGPVLGILRPVAAFVSGALCGVLADRLAPETAPPTAVDENGGNGPKPHWTRRALRHGFVTLPRSFNTSLFIGLLVAGTLGALVPADTLSRWIGSGWAGYAVMLAVGIPLYVCSTASVPLALGFIHAGISPGAAMVFLITGPATNAATLSVLFQQMGARVGAIYLAVLAASAVAFGILIDQWLIPAFPAGACHAMEGAPAAWKQAAGVLLLAVLVAPWLKKK